MVFHMTTRTIARALLTDDALGVVVVPVVEVDGVLVHADTLAPVDLVSLVVVHGLDDLA